MKIINNRLRNHSAGVGLIEVLVTTVVVALGLVAVASLQGQLVSGSRDNKTRSEAQAFANSKIEELRDGIVRISSASGDYRPEAGTKTDYPSGVTETFTRTWTVVNSTDPSEHKNVEVSVCWADGCPTNVTSSNQKNQIRLQTQIAFDAAGNSILLDKQWGSESAGLPVASPSTNAESSDVITENVDIPTQADSAIDTLIDYGVGKKVLVHNKNRGVIVVSCSSLGTLTPLEAQENLLTRRTNFDGVDGNEAIELYEVVASDTSYCIPRMRFNGGVIVPIKGTVISRATQGNSFLGVDLFTFNASETGAFCMFKPSGSNSTMASYVCYTGGNCTGFSGATSTDVTSCPGSIAAAKVGPGGWRGKVGLLGVSSTQVNEGKNVCFAEEMAGPPTTLDTARNYYTRRSGLNEGVNKPYSCHNFLIVDGQTTAAKLHDECVKQANSITGGIQLVTKEIQRTISTGSNVFDPAIEETNCNPTSYSISGIINNANSAPQVEVTAAGATTTCSTVTSNNYTNCNILTSATVATVTGTYNGETISCTIDPISYTGCELTFTSSTNPTYIITGNITGTSSIAINEVKLVLSNGSELTPCINNKNGTYICNISVPASISSINLTASIMSGATVTPNTAQAISLNGAINTTTTITTPLAPSFDASGVFRITGNISVGAGVNNLTSLSMAVDPDKGSCTLPVGPYAEGASISYSCTIPAGTNNLEVAIVSPNPACSGGGGSKKYKLSDGTTTAFSSVKFNLNTVSSDISKNISISKATGSGSGC